MSYNLLQLSPLSTRVANLRMWFAKPESPTLVDLEPEIFRSWLIYDPELDTLRRLNRDVLLGMALVLGVSASFWVGVGFVVAQLFR